MSLREREWANQGSPQPRCRIPQAVTQRRALGLEPRPLRPSPSRALQNMRVNSAGPVLFRRCLFNVFGLGDSLKVITVLTLRPRKIYQYLYWKRRLLDLEIHTNCSGKTSGGMGWVGKDSVSAVYFSVGLFRSFAYLSCA